MSDREQAIKEEIACCPRCKGEAHVFAQGRAWAVACGDRKCRIATSGHTNPRKAVEMWNKAERVIALERALRKYQGVRDGFGDYSADAALNGTRESESQ